jgi:hypothetical protein
MSRYVALLRGINVGGKNLIKMAELKACFEKQGFRDVVTYIQSFGHLGRVRIRKIGRSDRSRARRDVQLWIQRCLAQSEADAGYGGARPGRLRRAAGQVSI